VTAEGKAIRITFAGLPGVVKTALARKLARQIGATYLRIDSMEQAIRPIEVRSPDTQEHRRRVETRIAGIPGLRLPTWDEAVSRECGPWERDPLGLDAAGRTVAQADGRVRERLKTE
jgi:adenylate kinase family enzyme